MKTFLLIASLMAMPSLLWAQDMDCDFVKRSIKDLERELARALPNGTSCNILTPAQVGLTGTLTAEQQAAFNRARCQPLPLAEMSLAQNENKLLLSDGLRELRTRTTSAQNELARVSVWNQPELDQLSHFRDDVMLGALVQESLRTNVIGEILAATASSVGQEATTDWGDNLKNFCSAHRDPRPAICTLINSIREEDIQEFGSFLAALRPLGTLTATQAQEFANLLQISSAGRSSDFKSVNQLLAQANFATSPGSRPSLPQIQVLRSLSLSAVPSTSVNEVSGWVQRWNQRIRGEAGRVQSNLGGEVGAPSTIRQAFLANGDRHFLRARGRWTQLWSRLHPSSGENPCVGDQALNDSSFKTCVAAHSAELVGLSVANGEQGDTQRMLDSINNSLDIVARNRDLAQVCAGDGQTPGVAPAQCQVSDQDLLRDEQEHQVLKAIRDHLARQETRRLQMRGYLAGLWTSQGCSGAEHLEASTNRCVGAQLLSFPALTSLTDSGFQIVLESSGGGTPALNDEICGGAQGVVGVVCGQAYRQQRTETPNPVASASPPPRASRPVTTRRVSSTDNIVGNALVNQAIVGAISNAGNQWINNRNNISNFQTGLQLMYATPTFSTVPAYSTPFANLWSAPWSMPMGVNYTSSDLFRLNWGLPQLNTGAASSVSSSLYFGSAGSTSLAAANLPSFAF